MADDTTTITLAEEDGTRSLLEEGVVPSDDGTPGPSAEDVPAAHEPEPTAGSAERIAEMEKLLGRHREQLAGWEQHSQKQRDENQALRESIIRLEERLKGMQPSTPETPSPPTYMRGQLKAALQKMWDEGDASAIDALDEVLASPPPAPPEVPRMTPEEIEQTVEKTLQNYGVKYTAQQAAIGRHPDMGNPQSALYNAVWEQYDAYAADPTTQLYYPADRKFEVQITGPHGGTKVVDARIVDRLAAEVRLAGGVQEGRRQEHQDSQRGTVVRGNGQGPRQSVEALDLLTDAERGWLADPRVQKGWRELPKDPKAAAKFYFEKHLTKDEQAQRIKEYRTKRGAGV